MTALTLVDWIQSFILSHVTIGVYIVTSVCNTKSCDYMQSLLLPVLVLCLVSRQCFMYYEHRYLTFIFRCIKKNDSEKLTKG